MKVAFSSVFFTGVLAALVLPNALAFSVPTSPRRSTKLDARSVHFLAGNRSKSDIIPTESPYYVKDKQCGITSQVTSASDKNEICPPECPYYAQNLFDDLHCSFACVESSMCSEMNDRRPIPDVVDGRKICRGPRVEHCNEFNYDGTDTCAKCQTFYALHEDGLCYFSHWMGLISVIAVGVCGVIFAIVWIVDLILRPVSNEENLRHGEEFRSRQKLHTPKDHEGGGRELWPLDTNLCTTMVAGPGMLLHFNFQVFIMIWAFCVATLWVIMALVVDNALFVLGTRKFGTPRDNCILVAWGYETQQRLMWTKILFLVIVYIGSFIFCILHGVRQLRLFQIMDTKIKTMKDFVCFLSGMPEIPGSDADIEERITKCIADYTQQDVVGVSICWDWQEQEEVCTQALEQDLRDRELLDMEAQERNQRKPGGEKRDKKDPDEVEAELVATYGPLRRWFHNMEKKIAEEDEDDERPDMKDVLEDLKTTTNAFVVFHTEDDRDAAVSKFNEEGGLVFEGSNLQLQYKECEPETVYWINFGHSTFASRMRRLIQGFGAIFLALVFWTVVFYAPYAWSIMSFNYDNGAEPPFIFAMTFTMVVVLGNAIMYEVCARVSDYVGFKFKGDRESCYMILYTVACMFNVFLDMVTTYYMAWEIMKGLGFRTYDGKKLEDVTNPQERFESYAMQRILAENTFAYSFPSTFLIPFLLEPFITIYFPLKAGQLLVSRHPKIVGWQAEGWLVAAPMEMGRYADILLNVVLGILIFYFPGGYTHTLFYAMVFSHLIIYAFDHWRVLNTIPQCVFAMMDVDWWSQAMLAPCVSTILSCLVFKANCNGYGYCITGWWPLVATCSYAWIAHLIFHLLVLRYVVPLFGHPDCTTVGPAKDKVFKDVAEELACSWFTSNPIHCLRSKVIHNHSPHCMFWVSGKEHLQEENPSINCFFHDKEAVAEDYSKNDLGATKLLHSFSSKFSFQGAKAEKNDKEDEREKEGKEAKEDADEDHEKKQVQPPEDDDK
jgi:hypothetical protein